MRDHRRKTPPQRPVRFVRCHAHASLNGSSSIIADFAPAVNNRSSSRSQPRRAKMSKGKVAVLGINGHVGRYAAQAFAAAGWDVVGMGRSEKHPVAGVRFIQGDADSVEDMRCAIGDAEIVINALNLRYDLWFN